MSTIREALKKLARWLAKAFNWHRSPPPPWARPTFNPLVVRLLDRLNEEGITIIEWEIMLLRRLNYPLADGDSRFFLVPDDQIQRIPDLAAPIGLYPTYGETSLRKAWAIEHARGAVRFQLGPPDIPGKMLNQRLVFAPLSWTGLTLDETVPIPPKDKDPSRLVIHNVPPYSRTVPLQATCTALARMAAREDRRSRLRGKFTESLGSVMVETLFDTSYEGDYAVTLPNEVLLSEKEVAEIENAIKTVKGWTFRSGEEWIGRYICQAIRNEREWNQLPARGGVFQPPPGGLKLGNTGQISPEFRI
ncbi:hypothetical protein EJ06DRAFT_484483 [Trichodelitschia bisporula]|uniref:Uncharacterized protein n=1 Tax=Trichodelitschia bisporula TaxID=703511 RepID=A0A6G1HJ15_9PEZI|nr:hypothetical protein EJ06DRAFT_484483 [Trichodelitschia bisporula]